MITIIIFRIFMMSADDAEAADMCCASCGIGNVTPLVNFLSLLQRWMSKRAQAAA
jgi:hypothetical protein